MSTPWAPAPAPAKGFAIITTMPKVNPDQTKKLPGFGKVLPWLLLVGGVIGIVCSLVLTYDQIKIWQNPNYMPSCSLNPVVSCGSVIDSGRGDVFGIPAPFFGLITFGALAAIGAALLAGAKFKRWFWLGLEAGVVGGVVSALWLFWISMYRIHALCPFCLSVDVVVYTLFWYVTLHNIQAGHIKVGQKLRPFTNFLARHHLDILILWFLVVAGLILNHFWYYYGHYF